MTVHELPAGTSIWTLDADLYVVPTNAKGVFGAGMAKDFAAMFPQAIGRYQGDCQAGKVGPGDLFVEVLPPNPWGSPSFVCFFATKDDWREPSRVAWIEAGLRALWHTAHMNHVCPRGRVAMPAIGCGLGKLPFHPVRKLIHDNFDSDVAIDIVLAMPKVADAPPF